MRKMSITTIERGVKSLASQLETLGFECEIEKKVGDWIQCQNEDGSVEAEKDASAIELSYYLPDPSAPCGEFLVASFAIFFSDDYNFMRKGEPLKETPCYGDEKWSVMRAQVCERINAQLEQAGLSCRILDNKKFKVCPAYQMDLSLTLRNNDRLFQLWRYAKHRCMIGDALRTAQADYDSRTNWKPGWGTKAARDQAFADCIKYWTED